jgi:dienelactone hydrolase
VPWVEEGWIVVAPDSNGNGLLWPVWDSLDLPGAAPRGNADLALFDDLIDCVAAHHEVDAKRIYVAGQSAGGTMSNFVLGRRSSLLAGGIPASATFDLSQPMPPQAPGPMIVIPSWGGDNDLYSGSAGDAVIANVSYAEQSAIASQYWEAQPGVHQIACEGNEVGHNWLNGLNPWYREVLLAHPKGAANVPGWTMPGMPPGAQASCSEAAATYVSPIVVSCPAAAEAGCQAYCQILGDCVVENGTLGPIMSEQLVDLGFAATANVCSGCVDRCVDDASGSSDDDTVLACLAAAQPGVTCGPGFAGAAGFAAIGECCDGIAGSNVCERFCGTFSESELFAPILQGCD